jgi:hypothetical protein
MMSTKDDTLVLTEEIGPVKSRHCTDVIFLLLFLAAFVCMNGVGFAAVGLIHSDSLSPGDPLRLVRGVDYMGAFCGTDGLVGALPNKWEPNALGFTPNNAGVFVPTGLGICVSSCPSIGNVRADPYGTYGSWTAMVSTINVLGYCLPINALRVDSFLESAFADFMRSAEVISALGFVAAISLALLFLVSIRIPGVLRSVVWISVALVACIFLGGGYIILDKVSKEEHVQGAAALSPDQV